MKRFLQTMIAVVLIAMMTDLATAQTFTYPVRGEKGFSLSEKTRDGLHVSYNLGQFTLSPLNYRGEDMSEISISGMVLPNTEGCPNLPVESRMLAVPQGANARLNVIHVESEIIRGVDIAPALRIQPENEEPEFNYVKDQNVYGRNAFYPEQPFTIDRSSIRGVNVVGVSVSPFQYNPVTKELKVYTNIELSVSFEGGNGHFGDDRLRSPYWDPILAAELMNYDQLPVIDYSARMQQWLRDGADGAEYLIITPNNDGWAEYANQLKDYRTRQGILTEVYRLDEMPASTTDEMKAWFHNAYNNWTIPPVAVLLFGDHNSNMAVGIPAEYTYHSSNYGNCITDNFYADPTGDNLPDMVFSRLVAANVTEAQMMASKQIEYEYTNPNMDASTYDHPITALGWQTERWFQICSEAVGGYWRNQGKHPVRINEIYGGTPGSIWSSNQNTDMVVSYFGPNGQGYIPATPSELGGWTGGTGDQVVSAVNSGSMLLQHRDHGNFQGWGEPTFNTSYVNQMNNVGKMTFVNTINCQTGAFDYSSNCLIEAFMRRTYNGQNAGAVGCLGPTQTSYSFVNDTYVWGLMDQYDPDFLPDYGPFANYQGNWQPAFGNVAGKYFLQQSSWPYNSNSKAITYKMFTAHCDAFLRLYTQVPKTMEVNHPLAVVAGVGGMDVTAPPDCMISLVKQNDDGGWDILAVEEAIGSAQTIVFEPQLPATEINLVVTGQDYLRYEDVVSVVPAEGSYLAVAGYEPNFAPINQETSLSLTIQNVGLEATTGSTMVELTSSDNRLSILEDTAQLDIVAPETTVTLTDAFSFIIAESVEDNTRFQIDVTMTCGSQTWTGKAYVTAGQAVLEYQGMAWAGGYVPGDTLDITATFKNTGHYHAFNAIAHISSTNPYISFENDSIAVGTIEVDNQVESVFTAVISPSCPEDEEIPLMFTMNADGGLVAEGQEILLNTCNVIFNLHDSFGDGWNGNILNVSFSNGLPDEHLTIQSGSSATYAFPVGNNVHITLTWTVGNWLSECSFEIVYENQVQLYKSSGLGSGYLYEFDLDCAAQFNPLDVTVVANPEIGGTVTGAGTYEPGETCTITATPSEDYTFVRWTENGASVSTNPTYSFPVLANRNFVATFSPPINVTVSANPTEGGTVSGAGIYDYGTSVTITATANEGYVFLRWKLNGSTVSSLSTYSFTATSNVNYVAEFESVSQGIVIGEPAYTNAYLPTYTYYPYTLSQQIYTADEMGNEACNISSISFYNTGYFRTRNLTVYLVHTDKAAFENTTDWITVSESDQVYSGNVVMTAGGWATIYLGTPFVYDGSSNLALIVNDITGSWNSGASCRTFDAVGTQAIRVFGSELVLDPLNPSSYEGTLMSVKNQVLFGHPSYEYTVTATANPEEGGTISGGEGYYYLGQYCTLTATANDGYCFYNWMDGSTVVSTDATYTFQVMGNMNLVACFGSPISISVVSNPEEGGMVSGSGEYGYNQPCTLTATPNEGFVFNNWTKYDEYNWYYEVVSCFSTDNITVTESCEYVANFQPMDGIIIGDAVNANANLPSCSDYPYSMTQQIYTADEINSEAREISCVSLFNTGYYSARNLTIYMVNTDKTVFASDTDWITVTEADMVFSGSVYWEETSWTTIYFNTPFYYDGYSNVALVVNDETGESWGSTCRTFSSPDPQAIYVCDYDYYYTAFNPYNPSGYYGTLMWEKNQVVFGVADYQYMVTLSANPEEGGTVSGGGGMYYYGQPLTISATPNSGYVFTDWTKYYDEWYYDLVSCLSTDNVSVTESAEYVANFQQMDGIIIGDASHISYYLPFASYYQYSMSQQIYTADEMDTDACEISSVSFFNSEYGENRNVDIFMVNTNKTYFNNDTDWITVTEADLVFSGNVTMDYGWTTIYFSTPFNYDGTSNVALIVNDKTGNWGYGGCCRTFDANVDQAIYVIGYDQYYGNGYIIDPYHPTNYYGTLLSEKNQVVFGIASYDYTVTVSANPEEGGTVSGGGGLYYYGQPVTISATANEGYVFNKWTLYGEDVSYFATDNVAVMEDAEYVAQFQQYDGIAIGDAVSSSYYLPSYYYYSLSQQIYTAEEMGVDACEISSVSFFNTGYSTSRDLTIYMANTDKTTFGSNTDWIPVTEANQVFSGNVTLSGYGWTTIYFSTPFAYDGVSNVALIVDNNSGSSSSVSLRTFNTEGSRSIRVYSYNTNYDPSNPSGYSGTLMSERNQVIFGIPSYEYTVTLSANPEEGGTVTGGGGLYYYGQPITVSTSSNPGYVFNKWTKDNTTVSYFSTAQVSVTESSEFVANFQQYDGIAIGDAVSSNSYLPTYYYYSMTQQIYTAEEMGGEAHEISSVAFFNTTASRTRSLNVYLVHTDKTSFESNTDWITVTEEDLVFSGSVTLTGYNWATLYFAAPFNYDGVSNVALIVDDNTGSYNTGLKCRTFGTNGSQAIRIYSYNTNYDPYNPSSYSGTLLSEKNQVIFGFPDYGYSVTVTANPEEGGTVSGGNDSCYYGQYLTLTATANDGYAFNNWTKDGAIVSYLSTNNLSVSESAEYVANFQEVNGFVVGDATGTYAYLPSYSYYRYTLSQQIYTPDELGMGAERVSSVAFFNTGATRTRNYNIYLVNTNKTSFNSEDDWITVTEADQVFSGSVTMNANCWTTIPFDTVFNYDGVSNIALIVDDNTGSWTSPNMSCRVFSTVNNQSLYVYSDDTNYNPYGYVSYYGTCPLVKNQIVLGTLYDITIDANPTEGGLVTGDGTYQKGSSCTVTADPFDGYIFLNWTENGEVVSNDPTYTFKVSSNRDLVANFDEFAYHWTYAGSYEYNMTLNGIILINGVEQAVPTLEVGAFCGEECRGRGRAMFFPPTGQYVVAMTVGGKRESGEVITFRLYDHVAQQELNLMNIHTLTFENNVNLGTIGDWYPFAFGTIIQQVKALESGWNWWSSYIEQGNIDGLTMLENSLGNSGVLIKSQESHVQNYFDSLGQSYWFGSLTEQGLQNEKSYLINVSEDCTSIMTGVVANPEEHPVTLHSGWNWIGYPVSIEQTLESALPSDFVPADNDMIKSQESYATYSEEYGWFPSSFTLVPGSGYKYSSQSEEDKTLVYAVGERKEPQSRSDRRHWQNDVYRYANNLSILAVVNVGGEEQKGEDIELGAFVNGECRGSAILSYFEPYDRWYAVLTVTGEEGEQIEFGLVNKDKGLVSRDSNDHLVFVTDAIVGILDNPFVVNFGAMNNLSELQTNMNVYPNPVDRNTPFTMIIPEEEIVAEVLVVNALCEVVTKVTGNLARCNMEGLSTAGVYMVKVTCKSGNVYISRVVVK